MRRVIGTDFHNSKVSVVEYSENFSRIRNIKKYPKCGQDVNICMFDWGFKVIIIIIIIK